MSESNSVKEIIGFPGEGVVVLTAAVASTLFLLFNSFFWIEWSGPAFVASIALLIYRYRLHPSFGSVVLVGGLLLASFLHISRSGIKENAVHDAYRAHRVMIGCGTADRYLAFGGDPKVIEGKQVPSERTLAFCSDEDQSGSPSSFVHVLERERLLGLRAPRP